VTRLPELLGVGEVEGRQGLDVVDMPQAPLSPLHAEPVGPVMELGLEVGPELFRRAAEVAHGAARSVIAVNRVVDSVAQKDHETVCPVMPVPPALVLTGLGTVSPAPGSPAGLARGV